MKRTTLFLSFLLVTGVAQAEPLANMERERAAVLTTLLDSRLDAEAREQRTARHRQRLVELERMVIRDDRIAQRNETTARRVFSNYDLSFLVHASAEQRRVLLDHWLDTVGLGSKAVLNAREGYR